MVAIGRNLFVSVFVLKELVDNIIGFGFARSRYILYLFGWFVSSRLKVIFLKVKYFLNFWEKIPYLYYVLDSKLVRYKYNTFQFYEISKCLRGLLKRFNLPLNGQRSCSNAKTRKRGVF